jgi:hypothetical protein
MKTRTIIIAVALSLTGCVATQMTRSISVTRDADGKIISTTETETVTQPPNCGSSSLPIIFHNLTNWWSNSDSK